MRAHAVMSFSRWLGLVCNSHRNLVSPMCQIDVSLYFGRNSVAVPSLCTSVPLYHFYIWPYCCFMQVSALRGERIWAVENLIIIHKGSMCYDKVASCCVFYVWDIIYFGVAPVGKVWCLQILGVGPGLSCPLISLALLICLKWWYTLAAICMDYLIVFSCCKFSRTMYCNIKVPTLL
jgi:hypothetical protein